MKVGPAYRNIMMWSLAIPISFACVSLAMRPSFLGDPQYLQSTAKGEGQRPVPGVVLYGMLVNAVQVHSRLLF